MDRAKRDCILLEAAKAFTRFGFAKASVDDIARAAGVAKGTIYLAAPSKKELFYEVLLREVRAWNAQALAQVDPRVPADELLVRLAEFSHRTIDEHPLVRDLLDASHHELLPDLAPKLDELRSIGMTPILEVLRLGVRQGRFRPELDVEEVALLLHDLHTTTLMFVRKGPDHEARLARRFRASFDIILRGLLLPAAP